ncbi:IS4 family transposase [Salinibacter ruber]|uniref:IS4 family transposase n=1 Tax=Salinibacter ruber TaxID=146919 RepID=UPI000E56F5C4|nr:IS4 family transposase [Salinibacter ruber]
MLPYVKQLTRVLSERLGWNRARMKLMARLTGALPMQTTTNLAQLAHAGKPQVETDSTYRRLQRFFAEFTFGYEALGRFLLDLVPTSPPYLAVLDRTEWHFGQTPVNVLMIGIAQNGIAFPVAWSVLDHGGGSGADEHTDLLKQFLQIVDPEHIRALVADREFTGAGFLRGLKKREIPFVIRLRKDRRIGPPSNERSSREWSLPARMFARTCPPEQAAHLNGLKGLGGAESVDSQVVTKRLEDGSFLILAGRQVSPDSMMNLYRKRWEIETLFAALKSRGFGLEATHMTKPDRIRKLLGMLALTYSWTRIIGIDREAREGHPRECANGYPEKSLFRYGLDRLRELTANWHRMRDELHRCIQALIAPRSFLSCS